ncbi:hypothetical protein CsatA_023252 [Cannabis sativa]
MESVVFMFCVVAVVLVSLQRFVALDVLFGTYRGGLESLGSIGVKLVEIWEFLVAACEEPEFRLSIRNSGWGSEFSQNRNSGWATGLPDGGFFRTLVFLVFGFLGEPVIRRSASVPVRLTGTPEIGIQASNHPTLSRRYRLEYDQQPEYDRFDRSG